MECTKIETPASQCGWACREEVVVLEAITKYDEAMARSLKAFLYCKKLFQSVFSLFEADDDQQHATLELVREHTS